MKKLTPQKVTAENRQFKNTFVNHKESIFIMKSNIKAMQGALQLLTFGAVLSGGLFATQANAQGNSSTPRENPAQAQFDTVGKAIAVGSMTANGSGVSYRRIDGISLSSSNSNLAVTADEGLWRESLGLPIGSKILLSVSAAQAPADGVTLLKLKIEIFDASGKPFLKPTKLLLETSLGSFKDKDAAFMSADSFGVRKKIEPNSIEIALNNGVAELALQASTIPGDALVRVSSGAVAVQGEIAFLPDLRDMLVVGIVEGAINLSKTKGPNAGDIKELGFSDNLRNWEKTSTTIGSDGIEYKTVAGRVALFAKGAIKGEYLLTAAVDTDKITSQKLFRDIDPNTFYPIYGDSSVKRFDAQSASRVYVRIDKNKSYLLYGDFNSRSTDPANKLASMSRVLTGGQFNYENTSIKVNGFAAKTANKGYVDEQPARGISGPYALARPNAIANTETIELLIRDRNQPAIVLSRKTLARFADYDFEPFSGRVLFRQPVPSVDENNNPVSIRISYEVEEFTGDKHWVGGVSAKVNISENIALGAGYAKDKDEQTPYQIAGANVEVKLGDRTYFVAEVASSRGTNAYNQNFSVITDANPLVDKKGNAARIELRHDGELFKARAYGARSDADFQNASAGVVSGRQEAGLIASYQLNPTIELSANLLQTKDQSGGITDGASRDAAGVTASLKVNEIIKVEVGVNSVKEHLINGSGGALNSVGTQSTANNSLPGWGFNGTGLLASPATLLSNPTGAPAIVDNAYTSGRIKLLGKLTPEASLYGEYEQALGDGSRRRIALGGEYRVSDRTRLYASHEIENSLTGIYGLTNDGTRNASTIVGVSTAVSVPFLPDGQVYGEYRTAGGVGNTDIAAVAGVRNLWQVKPGLGLSAGLERQQIVQANGTQHDATAVSLAADYTADPVNRVAGKLEYRTSDIQNQWLSTLAYTRTLSENWSAIARDAYTRSEGVGVDLSKGIQLQNQFQMGLAYRDVERGRWNGLFRVENRVNRSSLTADLKDEDTWILSVHGTYHPVRDWTFAGQLAAKRGSQTILNDGTYSTYSGQLASVRAIWDFTERFDASIYGSLGRDNGQKVSGYGLELGAKVIQNLWFSLGYTKGKFADVDQFSANTSWSGWHARLRYKFDENSLGLAAKRNDDVKPVAAIEAALAPVATAAPVSAPSPAPAPAAVPATVQSTTVGKAATVAPQYEKITLAAGALFAHNRSGADQILPEGRTQLNALAAKLKAVNNVERVNISGHADITNGTGDAKYNDKLSLERAASVKAYLSGQGLDVKSVSIAGFGGQKPIKTDCPTPKGAVETGIGITRGRASLNDMESFRSCLLPNRRVEVEIYGQTLIK
jgi:outer membrane protein OmpA-like peptidoglycan-associated protein